MKDFAKLKYNHKYVHDKQQFIRFSGPNGDIYTLKVNTKQINKIQ